MKTSGHARFRVTSNNSSKQKLRCVSGLLLCSSPQCVQHALSTADRYIMFNMKKELRETAVKMRIEQRMSYSAIAAALKVSKSTLSCWLSELPFSSEEINRLRKEAWSRGEASRERYRNTMRMKKAAVDKDVRTHLASTMLPISERDMFIAGIVLYIGEGDKRNPYRVALANSDPLVVRFFAYWLTHFWDVPRSRIRFGLHLYSNMNIAKERKFWQDALGFDRKSFYKDQVRDVKSAFTYGDGARHGTCSVYVIGSEPKRKLLHAMKIFFDNARVAQW